MGKRVVGGVAAIGVAAVVVVLAVVLAGGGGGGPEALGLGDLVDAGAQWTAEGQDGFLTVDRRPATVAAVVLQRPPLGGGGRWHRHQPGPG